MPSLDVLYAKYISNENANSVSRTILVVDGMPFYRSSGTNSGSILAGTFLPFLGIESFGQTSGWFRKPGSMDELSDLSEPLREVIVEYSLLPEEHIDSLLTRFASLKCLLISSLLDESMQREEDPPSSFLSTSLAKTQTGSFWRREYGSEFKEFLKTKFPIFYQDRQYNLHFNNQIIDIRGTAKYSFRQRTLMGQANAFLEKLIQKPLVLGFDGRMFRENLSLQDIAIRPSPDSYLYCSPPTSRTKIPLVKKAKKSMDGWLVASNNEASSSVVEEPLSLNEPVKYTKFIWPDDLQVINITEEERIATEQYIRIRYDLIFGSLFSEHKNLMENGGCMHFLADINDEIIDPISQEPVVSRLNIRFLHNGQIIVYPSAVDMIYKNSEHSLEIFKVYNITTGKWMVLKTTSPNQLHSELLYLSGKDGISELCDYASVTWITNFYNAWSNLPIRTERRIILSMVEKYYPQTFAERLMDANNDLTIDQKARYMLTLLRGLNAIHARSGTTTNTGFVTMPFFHGDVKISNIMFDPDSDQPRIIDFDRFGEWDKLTWTNGWSAPECSKFKHLLNSPSCNKEDILQFNAEYGQAMDLWNMGMVFAMILTKATTNPCYTSNNFYPPFSFLHNRLNTANETGRYHFDMIVLTQKEIDSEIEHLLRQIPDSQEGRILFGLWSVVISMLKIDPQKRESAANLVQIMEHGILNEFTNDCETVQEASSEPSCSFQI